MLRPERPRMKSVAIYASVMRGTYLSSTMEELLSRKCSCSLSRTLSSHPMSEAPTPSLVNEVLRASLNTLRLDPGDQLMRDFTGQERVTASSSY